MKGFFLLKDRSTSFSTSRGQQMAEQSCRAATVGYGLSQRRAMACLTHSSTSFVLQNSADPAVIDRLMSSLDENNDGELTFNEFWQLIGTLAGKQAGLTQQNCTAFPDGLRNEFECNKLYSLYPEGHLPLINFPIYVFMMLEEFV